MVVAFPQLRNLRLVKTGWLPTGNSASKSHFPTVQTLLFVRIRVLSLIILLLPYANSARSEVCLTRTPTLTI